MRFAVGSPEQMAARVSALDARHPWVANAGVAWGVFVLAFAANAGLGSESVSFGFLLALPLVWRRSHPRAVFAVIAVTALVQWQLGARSFGDISLLVALYSVAVAESTGTTMLAAAVLEVGIVLATARWAVVEPIKVWIGLSGLATAAGVLGMTVRSRRALVTSLHERAARLEYERDQQGQLSAAAERARIAREMHDIVAHHLSVMIALADGASYQLREAPERAESAMRTASRTGRQALTEMRRLLGVLREETEPTLMPQPGIAQIDGLVQRMRAAGMVVRYELSGAAEGLDSGLQLTAHRIVQEALTNALKYAGEGAEVSIRVTCGAQDALIEVRDSGGGSEGRRGAAASVSSEDGSGAVALSGSGTGGGLRGMRERAAVFGGVLEAGAHPDGGWLIRVRLVADAVPAAPAEAEVVRA